MSGPEESPGKRLVPDQAAIESAKVFRRSVVDALRDADTDELARCVSHTLPAEEKPATLTADSYPYWR